MTPRHSPGSVRVSFAAILRIKADDRYILLHTPNRPGTFSPPGGVFKYFSPAERLLEAMGFREDRIDALAQDMTFDLRGYLPGAAIKEFRRWFAGGSYREDTTECLCREIAEELGESGLERLVLTLADLPSLRYGRSTRARMRYPGHLTGSSADSKCAIWSCPIRPRGSCARN
jgi:hypothetical protein